MTDMKKQILKVLVGSRAHGLAGEYSDYDYRGVYVQPTSELLKLGGKVKGTHWVEGEDEDNTAYEIGHFLQLTTKSNPTILEVFSAPVVEVTPEGDSLIGTFDSVWSSRRVLEAFGGYSINQRKKFLDDKYGGDRPRKHRYAAAYIRVLIQGIQLLKTGTLPVAMVHPHLALLKRVRNGELSAGEIINIAEAYKTTLYDTFEKIANTPAEHHTDMDKVNAFLLQIRKENW